MVVIKKIATHTPIAHRVSIILYESNSSYTIIMPLPNSLKPDEFIGNT